MMRPQKTPPIIYFIQKLDILKRYMNDLIDGKIKDCSFDDYFIFVDSLYLDKNTKIYK